MHQRVRPALVTLVAAWLAFATPLSAQEAPLVRGLLTGYGSVRYTAVPEDGHSNNFSAALSPLLLHQVGSNILFEAEMDLELEEAATSIHLEHAQVHYLGFEHLQITAGMFHLPFGIWMHPSWINKMPTPPLLYEDTHGAPPHDALLPILFDVGAMAKVNLPLFDGWATSADFWVSQGPSDEIAPHEHGATDPAPEPHSDAPGLGYGANFEDNNSDKMVGARLRAISHRGLTIQASGFRAKYDSEGQLGVYGLNVSLIVAPRTQGQGDPLFDLRGEGILLGQDYIDDTDGETATVNSGGYYVQLSKRLAAFEPVARWSMLPQALAGEAPLVEGRRQMAIGLNYWFTPSVPLKAAYNVELDGNDAFLIEWAVGF